jgi:hypothetical protein
LLHVRNNQIWPTTSTKAASHMCSCRKLHPFGPMSGRRSLSTSSESHVGQASQCKMCCTTVTL